MKTINHDSLLNAYTRFAFNAIEEPGTTGEILDELPWDFGEGAPDWNDYAEQFDECIGRPNFDVVKALTDDAYRAECLAVCEDTCKKIEELYEEAWSGKKRKPANEEHDSSWYAIKGALRTCHFIDSFPEDMCKERQDFDDMYEMVSSLQSGFETLFAKHGENEEDYEESRQKNRRTLR